MQIIIQPFQATILERIAIGELISAVVDGATIYAVKLMGHEDFTTTFAVLKGYGEHTEPHVLKITNDLSCASYGTDWIFEVGQPDEISDDSAQLDRAGAACIGAAGTFLKLGRDPFNIRSSGGHLDLTTLKFGNLGNPAFAVREWKVWASAELRDREGTFPLVDHSE